MSMRTFAKLSDLQAEIGNEIAVSDWMPITQEQVQMFADATGDHQWIHLDVERARRESPYGGPIAHGFLTLSLLPALTASALQMADVKMAVNYGLNKVRFPAPVPVGSRVRARLRLLSVDALPAPYPSGTSQGAQIVMEVSVEREGGDKPVCVAESISRRYA